MTQRQEFLRHGLLAKIHMHPFCKQSKELEAWEDYLFSSYSVRSCAELSISELQNLLDVLDGRAEPIVSGARPRKKKSGKDENAPLSMRQETYLKRLWSLESDKRGLTSVTSELANFSLKTLGFKFLYIQNLTSKQANKLITGTEYLKGIKTHK
jgi:hypothetical protein